jgi:transposase InsO family protein
MGLQGFSHRRWRATTRANPAHPGVAAGRQTRPVLPPASPAGLRLAARFDRGRQYTSAEYRAALAELGVMVSTSRKGNCRENAVAESFFATLKGELIYARRWPARLELGCATFESTEVFYNRQRLHSSIGYETPAEIEGDWGLGLAA